MLKLMKLLKWVEKHVTISKVTSIKKTLGFHHLKKVVEHLLDLKLKNMKKEMI